MTSVGEGGSLRVTDLSVRYGAAGFALRGVSVSVASGELVAILGANGAGKSTLVRTIAGTHGYYGARIVDGEIHLDGRSVTRTSTGDRVRTGLVQVPEGRRILAQLTVEDNLRAGAIGAGRRKNDDEALHTAWDLFPVLKSRRRVRAGYLSGGEQQMLAIGRALCADPKLLLLDEPTLGLAPKLVDLVADVIVELGQRGVAVLLVEQNAAMALALAHRAYVLSLGEVTTDGAAAEVGKSEAIRSGYLSDLAPTSRDAPSQPSGPPPAEARRGDRAASADRQTEEAEYLLDVQDLSLSFGALQALSNVSLNVRPGELLGLVGPNGAGKTSILNCVTGHYAGEGLILYSGRTIRRPTPTKVGRHGVGRTFQHVSAPPGATVMEFVMLGRERLMRRGIISAALRLNKAEERAHSDVCREIFERLGLAEYEATRIATCPYGILKRVDLARALAMEPQLLLLDEPFAGLHREEVEELLHVVQQEVAAQGVGVVLVDHNTATVFGGTDRVVVIDHGIKIAEGTPREVRSDPAVIDAYLGRRGQVGRSGEAMFER